MSDFEKRLAEALTSGAEQAPDAEGLAAGARSRARARRRTRSAVGAVVAVAALAVPAAVLATGDGGEPDDNPVATDPTDDAPSGWQTIEHDGVLVDVPGDWNCQVGEQGVDSCTHVDDRLAFYASAIFDPSHGPGLFEDGEGGWSGYVYTGDWVVSARTDDRDRAMQILASARLEGETAPDLSEGWRTHRHAGLSADVPASWKRGGLAAWCLDRETDGWVEDPDSMIPMIDCGPPANWYGVRFAVDTPQGSPWPEARQHLGGQQYPEGAWVGHLAPKGADGYVTVVAPTQALAELILGSVRP